MSYERKKTTFGDGVRRLEALGMEARLPAVMEQLKARAGLAVAKAEQCDFDAALNEFAVVRALEDVARMSFSAPAKPDRDIVQALGEFDSGVIEELGESFAEGCKCQWR